MKVWATLGYFDNVGDGRVVELDAADRSIREVLHFTPEDMFRVPSKGFTGACWLRTPKQNSLLVCGAAAVFRFCANTLEHTGTLSQPSFNDLHSVHVHNDRIYVANTGLDCVDVFNLEGHFLGSHSFEAPWLTSLRQQGRTVANQSQWEALRTAGWSQRVDPGGNLECAREDAYYTSSRDVPFHKRKLRDFVHPNHIWSQDGQILVTSLACRRVIDITTWRAVLTTQSYPHDGKTDPEGNLWASCVDGTLESRNISTSDHTTQRIDIAKRTGVSGWFRGLHIEQDILWVGCTEIRHKPKYSWDVTPYSKTRTCVIALSRPSLQPIHIFDLSEANRHTKIFAILETS